MGWKQHNIIRNIMFDTTESTKLNMQQEMHDGHGGIIYLCGDRHRGGMFLVLPFGACLLNAESFVLVVFIKSQFS